MKKFSAIVVLLLVSFAGARAQFLGTVSLESGYSDNMFSSALRTPAASTDATLMLGVFPEDANWAVNYTGALTSFAQYPDRLFSTHSLGGSFGLPYGEDGNNNLSLLVMGALRTDKPEYALYDYRQAMASLSAKHYFLDNLFGQASLQTRYRSYPNFGELGYLENVAAIGSMVFLESRTSIRIQAEAGFKNYQKSSASSQSTAQFTGSSATTSLTKGVAGIEGGGPGNGGGGNGGGGNGGGGTGGGSGWGGGGSGGIGMGQHGLNPEVSYLMYDEPSTSQVRLWVNIGQALGEQTGLSLRFQQRINLTERGRAFVGGTVDLIGEEELFDDPYSYEGSEASLTLTQILPWSMQARSGGFYFSKQYAYAASLDENGTAGPMRLDTRFGAWIEISKEIGGDWLLFQGMKLSLQYTYLRNQSNSTWYDYSGNNIGFGISTDF
ncbi:MAG: hypothetical protein M5R41_09420 [Bacteroidia bacterium]|nr:hypothetical protein [Bacteroidia bacterium]